MARVTSAVLVSALTRRIAQEGGNAAVLAKGDATAGGILLIVCDRGEKLRFLERGLGPEGEPRLISGGPAVLENEMAATEYWQRRRARDPDLWVVELDVADAERLAAAVMGLD